MMSSLPLFQSAQQLMAAIAQDDNTIGALALVLGVIGGWYFSAFHEQLKTKRERARKSSGRA
jgi:hypothetical protein